MHDRCNATSLHASEVLTATVHLPPMRAGSHCWGLIRPLTSFAIVDQHICGQTDHLCSGSDAHTCVYGCMYVCVHIHKLICLYACMHHACVQCAKCIDALKPQALISSKFTHGSRDQFKTRSFKEI